MNFVNDNNLLTKVLRQLPSAREKTAGECLLQLYSTSTLIERLTFGHTYVWKISNERSHCSLLNTNQKFIFVLH